MTISAIDLELLIFPSLISALYFIFYSIGKMRAARLAGIGIYRMPQALDAYNLLYVILCAAFLIYIYANGIIPWLTWPIVTLSLVIMAFFSIGGLSYRIHLGEHKVEEKSAVSAKTVSYSDINTMRIIQGRSRRQLIIEYARSGRLKLPEVQLFDQMYADIQNRVNKTHGVNEKS